MAGHGAKFGRKKEEAIIALLSQTGLEQAARAADISPRTLFRWLEMQEFKAAYLKARRNALAMPRRDYSKPPAPRLRRC
jgi:hypothetical protein